MVECVGVIIVILYYFIHKFKDGDIYNPRYKEVGIGLKFSGFMQVR